MRSGPATGRRERATLLRAVLPCLGLGWVLIANSLPLHAQSLTSDMLRPVQGGFLSPQDSLLRKTSDSTAPQPPDPNDDPRLRKDQLAPSRIGNVPRFGLPPANGAAQAGYDSRNRVRKKPKLYPGQAKPKVMA